MCGRFTLTAPAAVKELFPLFDVSALEAHYNIAPSQNVAAVRLGDDRPELVMLRWGLVPHWADNPKVGYRLINARAETAATAPAFRDAFPRRRCLVLADGFYEWQKSGDSKQPYFIHRKDSKLFAFAGLWEHWRRAGQTIDSCTILTTDANELVQPLHDRMPVILEPA